MSKLTPKRTAPAPAAKKAAAPKVEPAKRTSTPPTIRKSIATNLRSWMRADPNLDTQSKVSAASGVAQTTVGRILRGSVPATVDILGAIAAAFRRDPSDLLANTADVKVQYDAAKFARLPDYEKVRIEAYIKHVLAEYELPPSGETKKREPR